MEAVMVMSPVIMVTSLVARGRPGQGVALGALLLAREILEKIN